MIWKGKNLEGVSDPKEWESGDIQEVEKKYLKK